MQSPKPCLLPIERRALEVLQEVTPSPSSHRNSLILGRSPKPSRPPSPEASRRLRVPGRPGPSVSCPPSFTRSLFRDGPWLGSGQSRGIAQDATRLGRSEPAEAPHFLPIGPEDPQPLDLRLTSVNPAVQRPVAQRLPR